MKNFHAVMIDETGCEFGVSLRAKDHSSARDQLREDYPESRVDQLETTEQVQRRESAMYAHIGDWDDEGRPIFHC